MKTDESKRWRRRGRGCRSGRELGLIWFVKTRVQKTINCFVNIFTIYLLIYRQLLSGSSRVEWAGVGSVNSVGGDGRSEIKCGAS